MSLAGVGGEGEDGGDTVQTSLQHYLLCKLKGHPVLDAALFGGLEFVGSSPQGSGPAGLVVWGDPQRLLLLLEEAGATKKTLTQKYVAFRFRCRSFFQGRSALLPKIS